ncbi:MAG: BMC domain-containing protein [Candidatus Latescibacterota bacterium]
MAQGAIGLIETRGLVGAIEAADAAAKAGLVDLLAFEQVGGGLVSVRFSGDVAAVQVAVEAGVQAAQRIGEVICHNVMPAPHADLLSTLSPPSQQSKAEPGSRAPAPSPSPSTELELERLEDVPVTRLRQLVRQLPDAQLKGRQVSRANKGELIAELKRSNENQGRES